MKWASEGEVVEEEEPGWWLVGTVEEVDIASTHVFAVCSRP